MPREKTVVLCAGSSNGVDAARFAPSPERTAQAQRLRRELDIPAAAPVIGFVGRCTCDKGVPVLVAAYARLLPRWPALRLLLVGQTEAGDPLPASTAARIHSDPNIVVIGQVEDVVPLFHVMDIVALPTHREGFPNVVLEAGAAGKPVIAARVTGTVDAVVDGVNGFLVPPDDAKELVAALEYLLSNPAHALRLASGGRQRVLTEFSQERVWAALAAEYCCLLKANELPLPYIGSEDFEHGTLAHAELVPTGMNILAKRSLDVLVSAALLVLLSPLMAAIVLTILVALGQPTLFRQQRAGLGGRPFTLLKFRTMTDARDARGKPLPDEGRLKPVGRWLRHTSLDELPQLWNVLTGTMSLVGPRPLLREYLGRYSPQQARRHLVKPGITGWAQVRGRNALTWEDKFALDVWYVDHRSLLLDLRILVETLWRTLGSQGISQPGHATAEEFRGTSVNSDASVVGTCK